MSERNTAPQTIRWPQGLSEKRFLEQYWQQKPLLIPQAFPDFDTPLPADELAGLSLEPDTTPRLITRDDSNTYHLEHGPFEESRFASLTSNDWSLLVTDVEKHLPEMREYLAPFQFLPSWRIDDLMISYAPVGASVGAHADEYDVFLLQASGRRRWLIDRHSQAPHSTTVAGDLKLINDFQATDEWDLRAGDMLYLPPGIAHHGIASDEPCTTWSIGFRAPAIRDMIMRISEMIADSMPLDRYRDGQLDSATPGEITLAAIEQFKSEWIKATSVNTPEFVMLIGRLLTEAGVPSNSEECSPASAPMNSSERWLCKSPFSQLAWCQTGTDTTNLVSLFVDGEVQACSRTLAIHLCSERALNAHASDWHAAADQAVLLQLYERGCLVDV